jgi:hypothetical protein
MKSMFVTRIKIGAAVAVLAGCLAIAAAGVFAQQGPGHQTRRDPAPGSSDTARARTAETNVAPPYIRQSRKMIVERLEQELAAAKQRLERTARKVQSTTDPELLRARKTADTLAALLARIDEVLVDAVDQFATIFDFTSTKPIAAGDLKPVNLDLPAKTPPGAPPRQDASAKYLSDVTQQKHAATQPTNQQNPLRDKPVATFTDPEYDEHSLAKAAEKLRWSSSMRDKGYVSKAQHDADREQYESLKARIDRDIVRAAERVDWAKRMFEKGYVSRSQYDAEILKHYDALNARLEGPEVTDAILKRYEDLKRRYQTKPADPTEPSKSIAPDKPPAESQPEQ